MFGSHLRRKSLVISYIAYKRWSVLLFQFVLGLVVLGILFGLTHVLTSGAKPWAGVLYFTAFFLGAEDLVPGAINSGWLAPVAGLARLITHSLILGAIVFKMFVPDDVLDFRKRLLIRPGVHGWEALVRLYNATDTDFFDLTATALLRAPTTNGVVPFVRSIQVDIAPERANWPLSLPFVPYTLSIPLQSCDIYYEGSQPRLRALAGNPVSQVSNDGPGECYLIVAVRGFAPSLATEFVQTKWYKLSGNDADYEFGDFYDVLVAPGSTPRHAGGNARHWPGWDKFEHARPIAPPRARRHVIFGYGSLVDIGRLSEFLQSEGLKLGAHEYATLRGFRRAWSVAMDNRKDLPDYKYYLDAQSDARPDVYVAFLNIEHAGESELSAYAEPPEVTGVLFEIDEAALAILDRRERNYCRCDISRYFAEFDGRIWTYLGSPEAEERFRIGLIEGSVVIDAGYKREVETAFRDANIRYSAYQDPHLGEMHLRRIAT
ncbi:hypothetical protein [Hyphomicrobium sp.]|uniref:hypothetical protein n=1 Tax=Hyphomicrobium sp. TaxID=82 RepID=UPI0025C0A3C9|nr:hypothetical protein [Hyphomicrobium sp.]MCC7252462.1 hypothetical protein [Hyphomicrobium sp.]